MTESPFKWGAVWFIVGQSCVDNVFAVKRIIEKQNV